MRQIEKNMLEAIKEGRSWRENNTEVLVVGNHVAVYLYGNLIATADPGNGWKFSLSGWNTPTTRSRLSALGCDVCQRNGVPMRDGREWRTDF